MRFFHVIRAVLKLLDSNNLPASVFQVAWTTGMYHNTQLCQHFSLSKFIYRFCPTFFQSMTSYYTNIPASYFEGNAESYDPDGY
jgi:hypothetical protein